MKAFTKPVAFFTLVLTALCPSCKRIDLPNYSLSLLNEFPYAQQAGVVGDRVRGNAFHTESKTSITQDEPGALRFALRLPLDPELSVSLRFAGRGNPPPDARVRIEADLPAHQTQDYKLRFDSRNIINLKKYEGRVVTITFLASGSRARRLGGRVSWIQPLLEGKKEPSLESSGVDLAPFLRRHRNDNVLILLLDAGNPSHFGCYGYRRDTTPTLDKLAAEGVLFETAVTQVVSTLASTGTLFTGVYPEEHGVLAKPAALSQDFKTLAEFFRGAGYRTALFSGNPNASPVFGFGQGFEYARVPRLGRPTNADDLIPAVNSWLEGIGNRRFFAYVHFREPHWPYSPPPQYLLRYHPEPDFHLPDFQNYGRPEDAVRNKVIAAYDANLRFADDQIKLILRGLQDRGLDNTTTILVVADHGEGFWEHGKQGHNYPLYEEIVRIPMILRLPGEPSLRGVARAATAATMDIAPTLVDLVSLSRRGVRFTGVSLLPSIVSNAPIPDRFLMSQSVYKRMYTLRRGEFKYIFHEKERELGAELYRLTQDPGETHNLVERYPVITAYYHAEMTRIRYRIREIHRRERGFATAQVDEQTERELRALGYVN